MIRERASVLRYTYIVCLLKNETTVKVKLVAVSLSQIIVVRCTEASFYKTVT